jgi:hypothetical protein
MVGLPYKDKQTKEMRNQNEENQHSSRIRPT